MFQILFLIIYILCHILFRHVLIALYSMNNNNHTIKSFAKTLIQNWHFTKKFLPEARSVLILACIQGILKIYINSVVHASRQTVCQAVQHLENCKTFESVFYSNWFKVPFSQKGWQAVLLACCLSRLFWVLMISEVHKMGIKTSATTI